jgi:hypothetical protein
MALSGDNTKSLQYDQDRELIDRVQQLIQQSRNAIARTRMLIQESEELLEENRKTHSRSAQIPS